MAASLHQQRRLLKQHPIDWDPASAIVTLNLALDGCIVPSAGPAGGARVDTAHLVVLDNFTDEPIRSDLANFLTARGWTAPEPPSSKWERATCDQAFLPRTWGLKDEVLQEFDRCDLWGKLEVQSRLCCLYPEVDIAHMPSDAIQQRLQIMPQAATTGLAHEPDLQDAKQEQVGQAHHPTKGQCSEQQRQEQQEEQAVSSSGAANCQSEEDDTAQGACKAEVECNQFVANAAVHGDCFAWHVDADPWVFPDSAWTQQHGHYFNREPGKPLFVSLLLYLDEEWPREWDAETLFLDTQTDTGIIVRPKKYRAVLMDQDILHRLSPPSKAAQRPRYSLVWKLVMLPRSAGQTCSIARKEWGRPVHFGSAAKLDQAVRQLGSHKRQLEQQPPEQQPKRQQQQQQPMEQLQWHGPHQGAVASGEQ